MSAIRNASSFSFADVVEAGDHVMWPQGTGEPVGLTAALMAQAEALPSCTLVLGMVTTRTLAALPAGVGLLCLNGAGGTRVAAARSGNRIVPAHVSAIPGLIASGRIPVDVALVRARPTDDPSMVSLGVMVDFVHEMIDAARVVVAEWDERMPLTSGDVLVPRERLTHVVLADGPEASIPDAEPSETDRLVAERVASIVPDRATVQFGVGGLPVAVCAALRDHRGLGVHSGVLPDAIVDLIESGVVTNAHKGLDQGVSVTGGLFGTRRLFDLAHANPAIQLRRATHTHAAATMARLGMLHSINSAISIDLSGQVNAEVAGGRYLGAVGGQPDFVRGARLSPGGRSIIALASTTPDGTRSKIEVDMAGQPVTTARSDVDLVVTEFGVADLWGLDLAARAEALVGIAHPAFREDLARAAHGFRVTRAYA